MYTMDESIGTDQKCTISEGEACGYTACKTEVDMQTDEHVTTDAKINVLDIDSSDTEILFAIDLHETGAKISPCVSTHWCLRHRFEIGKYLYVCTSTEIDISVSDLGGMAEAARITRVTTRRFSCTDMN